MLGARRGVVDADRAVGAVHGQTTAVPIERKSMGVRRGLLEEDLPDGQVPDSEGDGRFASVLRHETTAVRGELETCITGDRHPPTAREPQVFPAVGVAANADSPVIEEDGVTPHAGVEGHHRVRLLHHSPAADLAKVRQGQAGDRLVAELQRILRLTAGRQPRAASTAARPSKRRPIRPLQWLARAWAR